MTNIDWTNEPLPAQKPSEIELYAITRGLAREEWAATFQRSNWSVKFSENGEIQMHVGLQDGNKIIASGFERGEVRWTYSRNGNGWYLLDYIASAYADAPFFLLVKDPLDVIVCINRGIPAFCPLSSRASISAALFAEAASKLKKPIYIAMPATDEYTHHIVTAALAQNNRAFKRLSFPAIRDGGFFSEYLVSLAGENVVEAVSALIANPASELLDPRQLATAILKADDAEIQRRYEQERGGKTRLEAYYEENHRLNSTTGMVGILSGIPELDRTTRGWQRGKLYGFIAPTNYGKSWLSVTFAANALKSHKVALFSGEMSDIDMLHRLVAHSTGIEQDHFSYHRASLHESVIGYLEKTERNPLLGESNLIMNPVGMRRLESVILWMCRAVLERGAQFIIVDSGDDIEVVDAKDNTYAKYTRIAETLFMAARLLNVPVVVMLQSGRNHKRTGTMQPGVSDATGSGKWEQRMDALFTYFRPHKAFMDMPDNPKKLKRLESGEVPDPTEARISVLKTRGTRIYRNRILLDWIEGCGIYPRLEDGKTVTRYQGWALEELQKGRRVNNPFNDKA